MCGVYSIFAASVCVMCISALEKNAHFGCYIWLFFKKFEGAKKLRVVAIKMRVLCVVAVCSVVVCLLVYHLI